MLSVVDLQISKLARELSLSSQTELGIYPMDHVNLPMDAWRRSDATLFTGDNLHYLKALSLTSPESVDLCYIDPPYNTGSKFIYRDNRKAQDSGPFGTHSSWMGFMLPRLAYAREIMKCSGVIAVSIDDYEHAYLKILMDRIFGEASFIASVVVCRSKNGKGSKKNVAPNHEYLLIYGKTERANLRGQLDSSVYDKRDEHGYYRTDGLFRKKGDASLRSDRPNMYYPLYIDTKSGRVSVDPVEGWKVVYPVDSKGTERRWLWGTETAREREWRLYSSPKGVIYVKNYAGNEVTEKRIKIRTVWSDTKFYTEKATNELTSVFGQKIFDTPKPIEYIKKIIDVCSEPDAVVMDFFAGSGTTAHAVAELNKADSGTRKCILMESNSEIPSAHSASEAGFNKIAEITAARLRLIQASTPGYQFKQVLPEGLDLNESLIIKSVEADCY